MSRPLGLPDRPGHPTASLRARRQTARASDTPGPLSSSLAGRDPARAPADWLAARAPFTDRFVAARAVFADIAQHDDATVGAAARILIHSPDHCDAETARQWLRMRGDQP